MYGSIVVGTDFSPTAQEAVWHAAGLAKAFGAKLHVVTGHGSDEPAEARDMLRKTADDISDAEDVAAQTHARPGDPVDAILAVASEETADLIVVGNWGMSAEGGFRAASVPNALTHRATCHVLVVFTS